MNIVVFFLHFDINADILYLNETETNYINCDSPTNPWLIFNAFCNSKSFETDSTFFMPICFSLGKQVTFFLNTL